MGSSSEEEEEQFFDSTDELSGSSFSSDSKFSGRGYEITEFENVGYEIWRNEPESIKERKERFLRSMGLIGELGPSKNVGLDPSETPDWGFSCKGESINLSCESDFSVTSDSINLCPRRLMDTSGTVLRTDPHFIGETHQYMATSCLESRVESDMKYCRNDSDLEREKEINFTQTREGSQLNRLREDGPDKLITFNRALRISDFVRRLFSREFSSIDGEDSISSEIKSQRKGNWLKRLGSSMKRQRAGMCRQDDSVMCLNELKSGVKRPVRMKVQIHNKRCKEFNGLYMAQETRAHKGFIWTMKFSLDGELLASGGEDGVVRIWRVMYTSAADFDATEVDGSCKYFTLKSSSELVPVCVDEERKGKLGPNRKRKGLASIVFPENIFKISEEPLCELIGHCGAVLDLSWSQSKYLLSASKDKTVRLWQLGCNECVKVFQHNNYVTCVQFNPVDEKYFISGSIDGKVRIWGIHECQVVDWADVREIITAVCYRPDGQGGIVGSIAGTCRFYDTSGNQLQLEDQICLGSKKKSAVKKITGFQFSPKDPQRVMVTSADSRVRILDGVDVVCKFRGPRNSTNRTSALFSPNGRHIVSAIDDSRIYIWNYELTDTLTHKPTKSWSCEHFLSPGASVAIAWSGLMPDQPPSSKTSPYHPEHLQPSSCPRESCRFSLSNGFSLSSGFFLDSISKASATWPEENLPPFTDSCCRSAISASTWGLVIVTAGYDGLIRSFQNYGLPVQL
ncbi:hypothetical protein AMTR_s00030p00138110 [Amborella trichopoda]|uniref:Anaphase-promoting complex subunit 4 WD40 domain-containing protein n=2 Tax=Amborella trichopoda TaxID=13333 RepID=U5D6V7_AMBTC|nr:hypothetical protein AMTR_s00030p00138110 [Amborella trichopoda]